MNQQPTQINLTFHPQRLIAIAIGIISLIFMFLPWVTESLVGANSSSSNGFRSLGFLTLIGIIGVVIGSMLGDRTKGYDRNTKMIVMGGYGAIALGAIIYFIILSSGGGNVDEIKQQYAQLGYEYKTSTGIGVWLTIIAGLGGLAWISGILNQVSIGAPRTASSNPPAPPSVPPPPPPSPHS